MKQKKLVLTPEEENLILEMRKKKKLEEDRNKPKKMGFLKHNIYFYSQPHMPETYASMITQSEKDSLIEDYESCFSLLESGTKCVCFIDDGVELWFDDVNFGIEERDSDWAKENLINIQDIK